VTESDGIKGRREGRLFSFLKGAGERALAGPFGAFVREVDRRYGFGQYGFARRVGPEHDPGGAGAASLQATSPAALEDESRRAREILSHGGAVPSGEKGEDAPVGASIIIPVYNKAAYTARCLRSILREVDTVKNEIVVVDNGSRDETPLLLTRLQPFVKVIKNESNRGFVEACNQGGLAARGRYLVFLNNDTAASPGWLRGLVGTAEADGRVGAVGSLLLFPDGRIQEAGAIIWRDGATYLCGFGRPPDSRRFQFAREVDYCSGASLLVRKELFERLGGFDQRYAPAYYEDADLCMGLRALGYKVVYQPSSRLVHYHGVTAGSDTETDFEQIKLINRAKFVAKWRGVLERDHLPYSRLNVARAVSRRSLLWMLPPPAVRARSPQR
jgi:GT2 family glycosyltransferase